MVKCVRLLLCVFFVTLLAGSYALADPDLDYVRQAIEAKGSRWHAEETSVSRLSHEQRKMKLGLVKAHMPSAPLLEAPDPSDVAVLPATLDWRNYNGGNWVTPVRDQGNCGSCWAFATAANLESATLMKNNTPNIDLNLSEQILVSCSGAGSCSGGWPAGAADYFKNTGLPVETYYPYTATNGTCSNATLNWQASAYKISGWSYVATTAPTVDAIKNALSTYGPVNTSMEVYSDFFYYSSGVYHYTTGTYEGGHAILIVGYDDATQCFICKNSWGTWWGEAGFFRIGYSELNSVTQFGDYTIAYQSGALPPPPTCSYSIPTGANFSSAAASGSFPVTTGSACAWTVSRSVSWITITSGSSGTGSGTVAYSVAANTGTASRTGSLTVGGKTFTITQAGLQTYTITATAGSYGTISPAGQVGVANGINKTFTIAPVTGYKIANVVVDGSSVGAISSYTFTNVIANHTISASFAALTPTTYTITAAAGSGGSISPSGSVSVSTGASRSFTVSPLSGYTISGVTVDGASVGAVSSYTFTNVRANHTISASFAALTPTTYTITAAAGSGGSISPSGSVSVSTGASRSFTVSPLSGYTISGVTVDGASVGAVSSYTFTNVRANHTIQATFTPSTPGSGYTLTVTYSGTGKGAVTAYGWKTSYPPGTVMTMTARPYTGSTFGGWSGGCSGTSATCTVVINSNITVNATFNSTGSSYR